MKGFEIGSGLDLQKYASAVRGPVALDRMVDGLTRGQAAAQLGDRILQRHAVAVRLFRKRSLHLRPALDQAGRDFEPLRRCAATTPSVDA